MPVLIDPLKFAQKAMRINGFLRVADFGRLADRLSNTEGEIEVSLEFGQEQDSPVAIGQIKGSINLICQRCMQAMAFAVDREVRLGFIEDEGEVDGLLTGFEPVIVSDEPMKVQDIIEDEILLMVPMIPMHEQTQCRSGYESSTEEPTQVETAQTAKKNPFAELEKLKIH